MIIQLRIIAGLLYIAVVGIENTFCAEKRCKVVNLRANCTSRGFEDIPQDLDMNLMDLDASFNPIQTLTADSFKRYPKLLTLILRSVKPASGNKEISHPSTVFLPLTQLINLDISESAFHIYGTEITWPRTLRTLSVGAMKYSKFISLNLKALSLLEQLNASHNNLESFPEFHPLAPIEWIDLFNNPLKNITAEHLAPYCLISFLRIKVKGVEGGITLDTRPLACQCRRLEEWMKINHIKGYDQLFCWKPPVPAAADDCAVRNFSDATWEQRKICLARQPTAGFWKWLILLAVLSLIFPAIYGGIEGYKYYKRKKSMAGTDDSAAASSPDDAAVSPDANDAPTENQESD